MRDVAVVAFAQSASAQEGDRNEVEVLMPVVTEVRDQVGVTTADLDFVCSGSTDYQAGVPFSFVMTLDAIGPWPPIRESHVDMDGAWALYEAWVKIQMGAADTALVYAYGKSSPGDIRRVLSRQLDPYVTAPLWPDPDALAALQARCLLDADMATEADFASVAARSLAAAEANPHAVVAGARSVEDLLDEAYLASPLRRHDCPPVTDGAAAVILAAGDRARDLCERPAWITGIDHRIDPHQLGMRDLTAAPSVRVAAERAGVADGPVDVAELHTPYSHQELIVRRELGLADGTEVNPSGGALVANAVMAAGLVRIGEVAERISSGRAGRGVAHATSGPCLQQNLVCVLEGDRGR
ncbi:MAG: thiolase domain-containing protein [Acidimicrobiia bacterium]|nr:thiolase domain-containing protein [Acidimicrobiia bacterium]